MSTLINLFTTIYDSVNSIEVNVVSSIFKLCLSLMLGCCVGFERKTQRPDSGSAHIRTHIDGRHIGNAPVDLRSAGVHGAEKRRPGPNRGSGGDRYRFPRCRSHHTDERLGARTHHGGRNMDDCSHRHGRRRGHVHDSHHSHRTHTRSAGRGGALGNTA